MKTFLSLLSISLFCLLLIFCIGSFYSFFYPVKFEDKINQFAQENDVSPALVASIINVESGYDEDAQSQKGAVGLMQIMPQTAEWICKSDGLDYQKIDLQNADDNINVGVRYLKFVLSAFENQDVAICAYNAGPSRTRAWLADKQYSSDGKTLDKIPFKETRDYLNKVKKNLRYYQSKYHS